MVPVL